MPPFEPVCKESSRAPTRVSPDDPPLRRVPWIGGPIDRQATRSGPRTARVGIPVVKTIAVPLARISFETPRISQADVTGEEVAESRSGARDQDQDCGEEADREIDPRDIPSYGIPGETSESHPERSGRTGQHL